MADTPRLEITGSRRFADWLGQARISLLFTTYQADKLFLIGMQPDGRLSVFERTFSRPMGLAADASGFWMAARHELIRFENFLGGGETYQGADALYSPLKTHVTGDVDAHDLAIDRTGRPVFVATLFNCLATLDERHSFQPLWTPPFIDRLAAEDRCHLNGLALDGGEPAYVTAVAQSNVAEGWRTHRADGGIVIDVRQNRIVARGLSMPHSPRLHAGRLWLLNAGTGELGFIDEARERFEPVAFCPGFLRGMAIVDDHAVVGLSRLRESSMLKGLPVTDRLERENAEAQCGLRVVNLVTGDVEHALHITGIVDELYDVAALAGVRQPAAIGLKTDEIRTRLRPGPWPNPHASEDHRTP